MKTNNKVENMCVVCQFCDSSCPRFNADSMGNVNWGDEYNHKIDSLIREGSIKLLIIGQSPYAIGNTGIAFCKPTWSEMLDGRYSGKTLLCSLGFDLSKAYQCYNSFSPKEYFFKLVDDGVVFINRYTDIDELNENPYRKRIKSAKYCICLGQKATMPHTFKCTSYRTREIHPSSYNENVHSVQWNDVWGYHGALVEKIRCTNSNAAASIKELIDNINENLT